MITTAVVGATALYANHQAKTRRAEMAVDSGAATAQPNGTELVTSLTTPIAETGAKTYGKFTSGVQWYIEQWEDLLEEARAERRPSDEGLTVEGLVTGLTDAKIAWDYPGYLRLRRTPFKGRQRLAEATAQALSPIPGVQGVEISSLTGSVLIRYDTARYSSAQALLSALKPESA